MTYKHKTTGKLASLCINADHYEVDKMWVPSWMIENSLDWQKTLEFPLLLVKDTYTGRVYQRERDGLWNIFGSRQNTGTFTILAREIGEGKRYEVIEKLPLEDQRLITIAEVKKVRQDICNKIGKELEERLISIAKSKL